MVSVVKRKKAKSHYYYMIHNTGKQQYEVYLGKKIPKDIKERKREFLLSIYRKRWLHDLETIKDGYARVPKSVKLEGIAEFAYYFTHDTQKIEGSRLTKQETYNLLRFQLTPSAKPKSDMIEAEKHFHVFTQMARKPLSISPRTVLQWHKTIFEKTKDDVAGKLREYNVFVTGSKSQFPHWRFVRSFVDDFFKWYKKSEKKIHPVELAGMAHFRFVNIHPFGDGNGRISRLLMNYILIKNEYPPLNIRYAERHHYYKALEDGNLKNDEVYFLKWFMKRYLSEFKKHYKNKA